MNKRQKKKFKKKRWSKTYRRFRNRELAAHIVEVMTEAIKEYEDFVEKFIIDSCAPRQLLMKPTIKEYGGIVYDEKTKKEI